MKKPRHHHHPFNIIEIALTLAIIGFAMASIMAIFPMGFSVTRDTMTQNYASDIGDQVLSYIQIQANTTSGWASMTAGTWNTGKKAPPDLPDLAAWPLNLVPVLSASSKNVIDGMYDAALFPDPNNPYRYFKITRSTLINPTDLTSRVTEMTAIAQLWYVEDNSGLGLPFRTIFVEVSWPAEKNYADRKTLIMCKQILNPN